jgi:hypothetical protein
VAPVKTAPARRKTTRAAKPAVAKKTARAATRKKSTSKIPPKGKAGKVTRGFLGKLVKKAGRVLKKPAKVSKAVAKKPGASKKKRVAARKK